MMVVIRHSEDSSETTYRHDSQLTRKGREIAKNRGKTLIKKYGLPKAIYCSPFRRTKETLHLMLSEYSKFPCRIEFANGLSRYFSERERRSPDIANETMQAHVPLTENNREFQSRVRHFSWSILQSLRAGDVVWLITHSTVYKSIARIFEIEIPEYIKPNDYFSVRASNSYKKWCSRCKVYHKKFTDQM